MLAGGSKTNSMEVFTSPEVGDETTFLRVVFPRKHCIMLPGTWNNTWDAVNLDRISNVSKEKVIPGYFYTKQRVTLSSAGVSEKGSMLATHYCIRHWWLYKHAHTHIHVV